MSSPPPPQLQLNIPSNSTSFKRSFGQLGIDIEENPTQNSNNDGGGDREAKRARSASVVGDGINDPTSSDEERQGSSLAGPSTSRQTRGDTAHPSAFAPPAMSAHDQNNSRCVALRETPIFSFLTSLSSMGPSSSRAAAPSNLSSSRPIDTPPRLPTPPAFDVDMPAADVDVSTLR